MYPDYGLRDYSPFDTVYIYNATIDAINYGKTNGLIRRPAVGGSFAEAATGQPQYVDMYGSRSTYCSLFSAGDFLNLSARGCNENRIILGRR